MHTHQKKTPHAFISVRFQLALIVASILLLSVTYYQKLSVFNSVDYTLPLQDYNPNSLAEFGNFYSTILTGLSIQQYEVFDVINNNFILSGTLWFLINPAVIDVATLSKFSFHQGTLLSVSEPVTFVRKDKLLVEYRIRLQFSGNLVYTYFPFDQHRIVLRLTNTLLAPQEAILVSEYRYFNITASIASFGWGIFDRFVRYGFQTLSLDSANKRFENLDPCVEFFIDIKRISYRYIISIIFPMLTFFYLSLFAFSTAGSSRYYLPTAGLTALISFRFIIDRLSPSVGYFMLSDYLFFTFLGAIFIAFVFLLLDELTLNIRVLYKKLFIILLHLLVIVLNVYFVL